MIVHTQSTEAFACYTASCRPPKSGGTGGSKPGSGVTVQVIRGDIQRERKAISAELDAQGVDKMNPLRHIFESRMGDKVVVVRDHEGKVVGGVQYDVDKRYKEVTVTDMRMSRKKQGHGTEALKAIAREASEGGHALQVTNAVSSAKPFYSKLGAVFQVGHATGRWPPAARDALVAGKPIEGGDFPYDVWVTKDIFGDGAVTSSGSKLDRMTSAYLAEHGVKNSGANGRFIPLNASAQAALEFACYDASCRPPTSGGTGGSKPRGGVTVPADVGDVAKRALARVSGGHASSPVGKDATLEAILAERGFLGKAQVVSRDDVTRLLNADEHYHMWRGTNTGDKKIARDFIDGEVHRTGMGSFGNGTYFAAHTTDSFSRGEAVGYGEPLIRAAISKKLVKFDDIDAIRSSASLTNMGVPRADQEGTDAQHKQGNKLLGSLRDAGLTSQEISFLLNDTGRTAALLGIPAYRVAMKGAMRNWTPDYVVVLDRRYVTVDATIYTGDGVTPKYRSNS